VSAPTIADAARRLRVRVVLPDRSPFLAVLVSVGGRSRGRRLSKRSARVLLASGRFLTVPCACCEVIDGTEAAS